MIAAGFGCKAATSVGRDPIPETRLGSHEPPVRILPLPLCLPLTVYEHPRHLASRLQVTDNRLQVLRCTRRDTARMRRNTGLNRQTPEACMIAWARSATCSLVKMLET